MVNYDLVKNYMIYFLVSKNFILLVLEIYRIYAIYVEETVNRIESHKKENENEIQFTNNDDSKQGQSAVKKKTEKMFIKKSISQTIVT